MAWTSSTSCYSLEKKNNHSFGVAGARMASMDGADLNLTAREVYPLDG
jgi:hypothetical protein